MNLAITEKAHHEPESTRKTQIFEGREPEITRKPGIFASCEPESTRKGGILAGREPEIATKPGIFAITSLQEPVRWIQEGFTAGPEMI